MLVCGLQSRMPGSAHAAQPWKLKAMLCQRHTSTSKVHEIAWGSTGQAEGPYPADSCPITMGCSTTKSPILPCVRHTHEAYLPEHLWLCASQQYLLHKGPVKANGGGC